MYCHLIVLVAVWRRPSIVLYVCFLQCSECNVKQVFGTVLVDFVREVPGSNFS